MGRIVFSIVSLVVLAVVIVMNAGTTTTFNLLGWKFDGVPIVAIAIAAFVVGALYSFIFYMAGYLARRRREKLATKKQRLKTQEQTIKEKDASLRAREKEVTARVSDKARELPASSRSEAATDTVPVDANIAAPTPAARKSGSRWFGNLIGRK